MQTFAAVLVLPLPPSPERLAALKNKVMTAIEKVAKQPVQATAGRLRKSVGEQDTEEWQGEDSTAPAEVSVSFGGS